MTVLFPNFGTPLTGKAQRFEQFHKDNPHVYREMCRFAREWMSRGGTRLGVDMLLGRVRWEVSTPTTGIEYKIANDHKPFYARLMMYQEPDLAGLFETRPAEANDWILDWARRHPRGGQPPAPPTSPTPTTPPPTNPPPTGAAAVRDMLNKMKASLKKPR